uniref:Serpentine receptor class gamma n=1 Tax=Panagrolaimus davidi TaxID=227884 RepID=A0A914QFN1_9BILA
MKSPISLGHPIWEKCLWPITAFSFAFPILTSFHILLGQPQIIPFYLTPDNSIYAIDVTNIIKISNALINAIHTTFVSFLSLIFNILTFIYLMLIRKNCKENGRKKYKAEKNLFIISAMDFGIDLISGLHQIFAYSYVVRNLHNDPFFDQLYLFYPWTYDIVNLSRPILLITVCQQMRQAFITAFWCSTKSKKTKDSTLTFVTIM